MNFSTFLVETGDAEPPDKEGVTGDTGDEGGVTSGVNGVPGDDNKLEGLVTSAGADGLETTTLLGVALDLLNLRTLLPNLRTLFLTIVTLGDAAAATNFLKTTLGVSLPTAFLTVILGVEICGGLTI